MFLKCLNIGETGRHALIILRGHELGGRGGGSSCDTQQPQLHLCFIIFFLFIRNIPKHMNYIMKCLDSHLYRLLVDLVRYGQSSLIIM